MYIKQGRMKNLWLSVNMAAQDEVDVCESWEDMDEIIGVSFNVQAPVFDPIQGQGICRRAIYIKYLHFSWNRISG